MVMTEVRKYMEAAVEKLTPAKAQEMARSMLQGQTQRKEQVQKLAQDLMDWSNQTRGKMSEMVRREVARQLKTMGLASKHDVEALAARVRDLERGARSATSATRSSAARTSAAAPKARPASPRPKRPAAPAPAQGSKEPGKGGS
jgi:hypothetical protein